MSLSYDFWSLENAFIKLKKQKVATIATLEGRKWATMLPNIYMSANDMLVSSQKLFMNIIYYAGQAVGFVKNSQLPVCTRSFFQHFMNM